MSLTAAPPRDPYDQHVLIRLADFFTIDGMPWPRRLWDIGPILAGICSPDRGRKPAHWTRIELRVEGFADALPSS